MQMRSYIIILLCLVSWQSLSAQAYPDRHNTSWNDAWISCETASSPNVKREPGHWIMYDLGDQYALHSSTIWNNNVPGKTNTGLQEVIIDVSDDGTEWMELGTFILTQGPASAFYQGDEGPEFGGVVARYVLISAVSNYGGDCFSLSEVKIEAAITTTTSFFENELDIELKMAPNPTSDFVTIELSEMPSGVVKYNLTSAVGKLFMSGELGSKTKTLNVSELPSGMYTLTIYNESGIKSELLNVVTK